jgi:hypothetical protein
MRIPAFRSFMLPLMGQILVVALCNCAQAMEAGQSPYFRGFRDFMTGVLPSPGVQVREDLFIYSGTERSTIPQGQLTINLKTISSVLSTTFVTPYQILGGDYAIAVRGAVTDVNASQSVATPRGTSSASGRLTGFNDIVVNPFIVGWHSGYFHWNVSASVWLPAGSYDKNRTANTGKNVWAFSPQLGLTYFDPKTGWEISGAVIFLTSSTNTATNYRSGDVAHFDFAFGKALTPQFKLGLVGYYAQQLADDSGSGAILGARKLRVAGLGPGMTFAFSVNDVAVNLVAKYYREFDAQNTTQGDSGTLSARIKF